MTYDPSQPRQSGRFAEKAVTADQRASAPLPAGAWERTSNPLAEIPMSTYNTPIFGMIGCHRDDYDVDAPYQRGSVWDEARQRDLIRSMLQRIPVGAVIRSKRGRGGVDGKYFRVVDGKQRLEALWAFVDDRLPVPADWFPDRALETVNPDGTVTWSGLSEYGRRNFEGLTIAVIELDSAVETVEVAPGTGELGNALQFVHRYRTAAEAVAYEASVYRLINTGGVGHTDDDLAAAAAVERGER